MIQIDKLDTINYEIVDKYLQYDRTKKDYYAECLNVIFKHDDLQQQLMEYVNGTMTPKHFTNQYLNIIDCDVEFKSTTISVLFYNMVDMTLPLDYRKDLLKLSIKYEKMINKQ